MTKEEERLREEDQQHLCCTFMEISELKRVLSSPVPLHNYFVRSHALSFDSFESSCILVNGPEFQWIIEVRFDSECSLGCRGAYRRGVRQTGL